MQKLANVHFRLSPESVIQLKNITPSELMFLIALHRHNAKDNPVVKLMEIPEKSEDEEMKKIHDALEKLEAQRKKNEEDAGLTEDRRISLLANIDQRIIARQQALQTWQQVKELRRLNATQERARLCTRYNGDQVKQFYPGGLPQLPKDFTEAQSSGMEAELKQETFLAVGTPAFKQAITQANA